MMLQPQSRPQWRPVGLPYRRSVVSDRPFVFDRFTPKLSTLEEDTALEYLQLEADEYVEWAQQMFDDFEREVLLAPDDDESPLEEVQPRDDEEGARGALGGGCLCPSGEVAREEPSLEEFQLSDDEAMALRGEGRVTLRRGCKVSGRRYDTGHVVTVRRSRRLALKPRVSYVGMC